MYFLEDDEEAGVYTTKFREDRDCEEEISLWREVFARLAEVGAQVSVTNIVQLADDRLLGELLERFEETMQYGDIYDRRELLGTALDRIELGKPEPNTRERDVVVYAGLPALGGVTPRKNGVPDGI